MLPVGVGQPAIKEGDPAERLADLEDGGDPPVPPGGAGGDAGDELPWEEAPRGKRARDPGAPSVADWEAHQATRLPFRVWCQECVKGRRDNPPHRSLPVAAREVPEVGMDY